MDLNLRVGVVPGAYDATVPSNNGEEGSAVQPRPGGGRRLRFDFLTNSKHFRREVRATLPNSRAPVPETLRTLERLGHEAVTYRPESKRDQCLYRECGGFPVHTQPRRAPFHVSTSRAGKPIALCALLTPPVFFAVVRAESLALQTVAVSLLDAQTIRFGEGELFFSELLHPAHPSVCGTCRTARAGCSRTTCPTTSGSRWSSGAAAWRRSSKASSSRTPCAPRR